jgi:hypothetical protein
MESLVNNARKELVSREGETGSQVSTSDLESVNNLGCSHKRMVWH